MKRIQEFESLRGLLALWVVVGHCIKYSGYERDDFGRMDFLADPGLAVDVFIILSGFVIFSLLEKSGPSYRPYIVQRFFRLFPVYFLVLVVSALTAEWRLRWAQALPWESAFLEGVIPIYQASRDFLPAQFMVHVSMLHGMVPDKILPFGQYSLVGQAWSLSVEWQFYLVAPLLFVLLKSKSFLLVAVLGLLVVLRGHTGLGEGFAINQFGLFLIGIFSYFTWRGLEVGRIGTRMIWLGCFASIALVISTLQRWEALAVWIVWFTGSMCSGHERNLISRVSALAPFPWLGKISYSVYLWHALVLWVMSQLAIWAIPGITPIQHLMILTPATVLTTIGLSALTFRAIESPFIAFGHSAALRNNSSKVISQA